MSKIHGKEHSPDELISKILHSRGVKIYSVEASGREPEESDDMSVVTLSLVLDDEIVNGRMDEAVYQLLMRIAENPDFLRRSLRRSLGRPEPFDYEVGFDTLAEAMESIRSMAGAAYPKSVFPDADLDLVRKLLHPFGITVESFAATIIRLSLTNIYQLANEVLSEIEEAR